MTTKRETPARRIAKLLKDHNSQWNNKAVSCRNSSYSMGSSSYVTIKDAFAVRDFAKVEEIANTEEHVDRCEYSGEILSGGNHYVDVKVSDEAEQALAAPLLELARPLVIAALEARARGECAVSVPNEPTLTDSQGNCYFLIPVDAHNYRWQVKQADSSFSDDAGCHMYLDGARVDNLDECSSTWCKDAPSHLESCVATLARHMYVTGVYPWPVEENKQRAAAVVAGGFTIEQHKHTKKNRTMVLAIPTERLERDSFNALRDEAKACGGWYSRAFAGVPGGFAWWLDEEGQARAADFVASAQGVSLEDAAAGDKSHLTTAQRLSALAGPVATTTPCAPTQSTIDKLERMANNMDRQAQGKFSPRSEHTPRQQRMAASARIDGRQLERAAGILRAWLASDFSEKQPTKAEALKAAAKRCDTSGGYYSIVELEQWSHDDERSQALRALGCCVAEKSEEDKQAEALQALRNSQIAGFFPTPASVADMMAELAELEQGELVLDPGAGTGELLLAARRACDSVRNQAFEINHTLANYVNEWIAPNATTQADFLDYDGRGLQPDVILINPPYENDQALAHVAHACRYARRRVVALVPAGVQYYDENEHRKPRRDFAAGISDTSHSWHQVDPKAFQSSEAFRKAGVSTVILVVDTFGGVKWIG